jgi:hypothetical protein
MSMKTKDKVKKSKSRGVQEWKTKKRRRSSRSGSSVEGGGLLLDVLTPQLVDDKIQGTKRECL